MSFRVRAVSGRSLVPCPPTRMTAGRLTSRSADRERGGVRGTGRFPVLSRIRGPAAETWFRPRTRAAGERWSCYGPADALVREAERAQRVGVEEVPTVHHDALSHPLPCGGPVEVTELGPLGHENGGVRAVERLERRLGDHDAVELVSTVRHRVPRGDVRAFGEEPPGEDEARRLAHVVSPRLEREAEECDPLPAERPEATLELPDDAPLLELVHLDDGVQELEVVARVGRQLLERERILREAGATEADAGTQERRADAPVEADALGDRRDVGAGRLADVRDLVDERDAGDERGIRRELDHL